MDMVPECILTQFNETSEWAKRNETNRMHQKGHNKKITESQRFVLRLEGTPSFSFPIFDKVFFKENLSRSLD